MDSQICTSFSRLTNGIEDPREWASLYYAFYAHRCGLKITIDRSVEICPFVNLNYDNRIPWSDAHSSTTLKFARQDYYKQKSLFYKYNDSETPGFINDPTKWWLNGHTLCNIVPQNIWSLRGVKGIQSMLNYALPILIAADVKGTFVLNKRDCPIFRKNFMHPFFDLNFKKMHPSFNRPMRYPLSFYVGPLWNDIAFPIPEAWEWAHGNGICGNLFKKCFSNNGHLSKEDFDKKKSKAVFRGTATGGGLNINNQRILLVSQNFSSLDAGITAWNQRDRVHNFIIDFQEPLFSTTHSMSPDLQSQYKILIYVDGHQASSRLLWHLASGCALIMIESNQFTLAPKIWIHDYLQENVHYLKVKQDCSDLEITINKILNNSELSYNLASNAYKLANSILRPDAIAQNAAKAFICAQTYTPS